jgi:AraC-like DNA-binding protein
MKFRHSCNVSEEHATDVAVRMRPWIAQITKARSGGDAIVVKEPDHAITLTLRTAADQEPLLLVAGPRTRALYHEAMPGQSCLKVRLHPGAARQLLHRSIEDLVDRVVPLAGLPGPASRPVEWPADPGSLAESLLAGAPPVPDDRGALVRRAADLLPTSDVRTSARRLHISERHLRNLFVREVGLPPKRFARIGRVRTVLELGTARPLSELAIAAGFYDHSHMTAEFRTHMDVPPAAFFAGEFTPTTRCGGEPAP